MYFFSVKISSVYLWDILYTWLKATYSILMAKEIMSKLRQSNSNVRATIVSSFNKLMDKSHIIFRKFYDRSLNTIRSTKDLS